jgi:hypothetical protein
LITSTLEECFAELDNLLSDEDKKYIQNSDSEKIMIDFHHSLGQHLRNSWDLWKESPLSNYFNKLGIDHPDDMSGIILDSYWRMKHNEPIALNAQIQHYKDYWAKNPYSVE